MDTKSEDIQFIQMVNEAAFANPFSDERLEIDGALTGGVSFASRAEQVDQVRAELTQRLNHYRDRNGRIDRVQLKSEAAGSLNVALLFETFHDFIPAFDRLIVEQMDQSHQKIRVAFAGELLERLRLCGYTPASSRRYLAIFFQIRRAFYFLNTNLIGSSAVMKQLRSRLWNTIFTHDIMTYERLLWDRMEDYSTLLLGETGTGKGAAAAAVGRAGFIPYDEKSQCFAANFMHTFIGLNLSEFSETLIESELFGHRKGAFTGAIRDHDGVFARCSAHGSIFLDEVGDVPVPVQIKLLRVLQDRQFTPVGSHDPAPFYGRVIAATNQDITALRREGRFRDDFYFRLCTDEITVPPLRARLQESSTEFDLLLDHILQRLVGPSGLAEKERVLTCIRDQYPASYPWPGNVRELEQSVRRVLLHGSSPAPVQMHPAEVPDWLKQAAQGQLTADQLLGAYCTALYEQTGSYQEAARIAELNWRTVKKHMDAQAAEQTAS